MSEQKQPELKPCPFCGSRGLTLVSFDPFDGYMGDCRYFAVKCLNCGATIKELKPDVCVEKWNRRTNNET